MAKTISRMQNRIRNIMLSDFRLQYKVTVAKTIWYWQKNRHKDWWNLWIERPEINLCTYGQLIYDKEGKNTQQRKDYFFNSGAENWQLCVLKKMKLERSLTLYQKKKKKTQNGRPENRKLEENIGRTLFDVTIIFWPVSWGKGYKSKNKQMGPT